MTTCRILCWEKYEKRNVINIMDNTIRTCCCRYCGVIADVIAVVVVVVVVIVFGVTFHDVHISRRFIHKLFFFFFFFFCVYNNSHAFNT